MPLLDTIKSVINTIFEVNTPTSEGRQSGLQRPVTREMETWDRESLRHDRQTKIAKCQQMQKTDPRVARILRKLASDAAVGGFEVMVESATTDTEKEKAQEIIKTTLKNCKLVSRQKGWMRSLIRDGDLFLEITVEDKEKEITRAKKLAAAITFSNMNSEGDFTDDEEAFYQEHPWSREKIRTFERWQIIHLKWDDEDGQPYGEPLLGAARLTYDRLDSAEKNVVIRRAVRAGQRKHHKLGTPDQPGKWEHVEEYKERNKDTLEHPLDAVQDYFSTGNVEISTLQGDDELGELSDIQHFEGMLSMVAGIPMALLSGGREQAINRDVLEEQEEDYYRVIEDINDLMESGYSQIFNFALALQGINPDSIEYTFNWGAKDRDDVDSKIDRALKLQKLGFSFETIFHVCDLDKLDLDEETERIRNQVNDGVIPYGINIDAKLDFLTALGVVQGTQPQATPNNELPERIKELRDALISSNGHQGRLHHDSRTI